ncbi:MAG: flagellar motor protein MotB [Alphaproteobacteria bacterium]|nr:flagellar motor protein MotB [Alphaproteobacteria bacterium]
MPKAKKAPAGSGAPEWLVTFADLMSLLVCFFVLIISFSVQDTKKLQIVVGSMRDAFGVKKISKVAGIVEIEGGLVGSYIKNPTPIQIQEDIDAEGEGEINDKKEGRPVKRGGKNTKKKKRKNTAQLNNFIATSLNQAIKNSPELSKISDQILLEETEEGVYIQILDQEGRSMFPKGEKQPYERTRVILQKLALLLNPLPNRIIIEGHTNSNRLYDRPGYTQWELSAERANAARTILSESGLPNDRIFAVTGKADRHPLFPDNPFLAANRRISILLISEAPPIPIDHNN